MIVADFRKVIKDETTSIHHNADSLCVGKG